jgi:hypothetical protein
MMDLKGFGRKQLRPKFYPDICLKVPRKATKNIQERVPSSGI